MLKLGFSTSRNNSYVIRNLYYFIFNGFSRLPLSYSTSTSTSSIDEGISNNSCSFAKFLVDSLGFSTNQSIATSTKLLRRRHYNDDSIKVVNFNFVDNARFVIHFFEKLGFQQSDIRNIVSYEPRILAVTRVSLQSKVNLLVELGFSGSNLVKLVVTNPLILYQTLGPAIHALRAVLGTDDDVARILWRLHKICLSSVANYLIPNTQLCQEFSSVSSDRIKKYVLMEPKPFSMKTDKFRDLLIRIEQKLGIPRNSANFLYGIHMISFCTEKTFENKCAVFRSFGWTQSGVMGLIRRKPLCLKCSEARIRKQLDFLMNQVGYKPDDLDIPLTLFTCSLEKRLLPRHRVLQVLKEKGLLQRNCSLPRVAYYNEGDFIRRFVLPFKEVHELYAQLTSSTVESLNVGSGRAKADPGAQLDYDIS